MSAFLSPIFGAAWQSFNNTGGVNAGGKVYTYVAGSTTPAATWTDSTQGTPNANPIILNSAGRLSQEVWLQSGAAYKFMLQDSAGNTLGTYDNISGVNDTSSSQAEWISPGVTPTYISATSFTVPGNQTTAFATNRRFQAAVTAGTIYGYVASSSFGSVTTVNTINDSGSLDSGLSSVNLGVLTPTNPSVPQQYVRSGVAVLGNIVMAGFKGTGLGAGSAATDSVRMDQLQTGAGSTLGTVAGTNTITAAGAPTVTAYSTNQTFRFIPAATNTGATTINIDGLGAKSIFWNGAACAGGELRIGVPVQIFYDGTQFDLMAQGGAIANTPIGQTNPAAGAFTTLQATNTLSAQTSLTGYLLPSDADKWRGIYRAGFDHTFRNQQWGGPFGGELLDGATDTLYRTEFATGYIDGVDKQNVGADAPTTWRAQGFEVSETQTVAAVWIKLYKVGNPTANFSPFIYTDTAGSPNALLTNGTATVQSGKLHSADTTGTWYRFAFATPPTLTGGTQYHIACKSSAAVDASNYWCWKGHAATPSTYPFGFLNQGDATPTWTQVTATDMLFLVELSAAAQISQSSGIFDGKLAFGGSGASGTLSMSRGLCSSVPLLELLDTNEFTLRVVGNAFTKDATILDIGYGQDHDRIVLRSAVTTGYATLTVYGTTGTVYTVTGSTDVSSGNQDIAIHVRAKADGLDKVELYVNGASQGTPLTSQTITFDANFRNLGTMWIGGGFALAPTYSGSSIGINGFSGLPSTLGWTYAGTATEANAFSVSGGKLFQNKNGYASTDTGKYTKSTAGFSNTNGWTVVDKFRCVSSTNTKSENSAVVYIQDGAKISIWQMQEYYTREAAIAGNTVQSNFKSSENVFMVQGKGLDFFTYTNNRFSFDGTGISTSATATNDLTFGDNSATAGENADVVYSYWKYYTTAWTPPQFTSGSISELAIWSGDRTSILASLYNAGTLVSVKQYCGLPQNYLDKSGKLLKVQQLGITSSSTSTSWNPVTTLSPEMEVFVIGSELGFVVNNDLKNDGINTVQIAPRVDGVVRTQMETAIDTPGVNYLTQHNMSGVSPPGNYLGLHKVAVFFGGAGGTTTSIATRRNLVVEAKL